MQGVNLLPRMLACTSFTTNTQPPPSNIDCNSITGYTLLVTEEESAIGYGINIPYIAINNAKLNMVRQFVAAGHEVSAIFWITQGAYGYTSIDTPQQVAVLLEAVKRPPQWLFFTQLLRYIPTPVAVFTERPKEMVVYPKNEDWTKLSYFKYYCGFVSLWRTA